LPAIIDRSTQFSKISDFSLHECIDIVKMLCYFENSHSHSYFSLIMKILTMFDSIIAVENKAFYLADQTEQLKTAKRNDYVLTYSITSRGRQ